MKKKKNSFPLSFRINIESFSIILRAHFSVPNFQRWKNEEIHENQECWNMQIAAIRPKSIEKKKNSSMKQLFIFQRGGKLQKEENGYVKRMARSSEINRTNLIRD